MGTPLLGVVLLWSRAGRLSDSCDVGSSHNSDLGVGYTPRYLRYHYHRHHSDGKDVENGGTARAKLRGVEVVVVAKKLSCTGSNTSQSWWWRCCRRRCVPEGLGCYARY